MDINEKIYSDGDIEDLLIDALRKNKDVFSIPYNGGAVFHNFTDARENLVNWYPFQKDASVLEIGAGMGALTGILCDSCANVTAVEQSPKRAEIIRLRHKAKKNLNVLCGDIKEIKFDQKFDYILLIGVLEYVGIGASSPTPYTDLLNMLNCLLADEGMLLIAIENRFGLKYWCGASEDHTGIPFDGISGYLKQGYTSRYGDKGVCTFSRFKLSDLLDQSGFTFRRWYYPLPDYKFPMAVFSEQQWPSEEDIESVKFCYPAESELIANEKRLYGEIISNGTFPFFANSFFVEAGKVQLNKSYIQYASFKRDYKEQYRIITKITNSRTVIKTNITDTSYNHLIEVYNNTNYLRNRGIPVIDIHLETNQLIQEWQDFQRTDKVFQEFLSDNDLKKVLLLLDILKNNLLQTSAVYRASICKAVNNIELKFNSSEDILKEGFIDMTFLNSFYNEGQLYFFDQEWKFENIPVKYILYRAIKYAYKENGTAISVADLYRYVGINEELCGKFDLLEDALLNMMMDQRKCREFDPNMYHEGLTLEYKVRQQKEQAAAKFTELNQRYIAETEQFQREITHCHNNIEILQNEITEKEKEIEKQELLIKKQEEFYLQKSKEFNTEINRLQEKISVNEANIQFLNQTVLNKEGHIEQLLEAERENEREKASRTYRLALKFRNASLRLFPLNSKRRFFSKMLAKGIRHPGMMLKMVNPRRVKNCITILKTEGMDSAENHYRLVEEYEKSRTVPLDQKKLEVVVVQETEKQIGEYAPLTFMEYEAPEVSIIIPVYNQFDYTYHCLEAILKNSGTWRYEVVIADDCSTDLTTRLAEVASGVNIIRNQENLHFLRNCNHAAKQVRGEYIVFLNNDTQVQKDWLTPLIELMRRDNTIGMTGSKLLYADGYLQEAGGILWKDASAWNYGSRQNPNDSEFNYVHEVDYISGAAIMIRSALWKEIGGFDETFAPAYCEDSDLAFEVRRHGYKVMYQPKSVVVHFEGISNGTDLSSGQKKYQVENQKKFYEKWRTELEQQHYVNGTELFLARDRGAGRKHVLVIDHYVPQYDKDAGSKTTFMYLKMLVSKGYHITFLGDNFYQHEPYTTQLQQMGILVLYGPKYAENWKEWLRENIRYFDLFYLNRPHITVKYIDFIKENARGKIIYYGHDLHFLRIQREYELSGDKKLEEEAQQWKRQELSIMRKADMNYYPSAIECEEIRKIDSSIPVKAITAYVYEQFRKVCYEAERREGLLFVGGFGHGPNLDAVLWFLDKIYPGIYEKTQAPFYIVGSKAPDEITRITTPGVTVKGFVSEDELQELYESCRIAVVPLRYGAGVKGKVVEALYYGIPILTTSVGAEGIEGIEDIAVIRDQEEALIEAACSLYQSPDRLKEMSALSQRYVRDKFSTEAVWEIIQEDFV